MTEVEETRRTFWGHVFDCAFKVDWIDAGGVRTRYIEAGDPGKPSVVLLHGIAGSLENFMANVGPLSKHFHVLAFDFVGTGLSDKPDHPYEIKEYVKQLSDFLSAKGIEKTSLIGLSLGSWVTMSFAAKYPERVDKVVLIAPAGLLPVPAALAALLKAGRMAAMFDPTWENMKTVFAQLIYDDANKIDDVLLVRQNIYKRPDMKNAANNIMVLGDAEVSQRNLVPENVYRELESRLLLIECPDAVDMAHATLQEIRKLNPQASVESFPKTLHWPQFEEPERFNAVALAFLDGQ